MEKYGVLIVDDSALMRKTISAMIEASPQFYIIGKARNGRDAIEKIKRLKPTIVTMDIDLPELGGIDALKIIMQDCPVSVVILSNEANSSLEAIECGAVDFVLKNQLIQSEEPSVLEDFHRRLFTAVNAKLPKQITEQPKKSVAVKQIKQPPIKGNKELLIIGSSTGGPSALQTIMMRLPQTLHVPVLIIQHMPPGFTKPLASRFDALGPLTVKEAEHNEILQAGTIYIAPAGIQTMLKKSEEGHYVVKQKITTSVETLYKPSIDVTLLALDEASSRTLLMVVLTGMGDDGLKGCRKVKRFGATILAESEETCVVYGMPKVVAEAGLVDKQLPLPQIFDEIMSIL
ncbi:MAG: chemotaxis-specific protein-glutamate methyltransferase CheB [Solibacillus sp.]